MDIPFRHIVTVAQIAEFDHARVCDILKESGYIVQNFEALAKRISYARNWLERFAPDDVKFQVKQDAPAELETLTMGQKKFLGLIAEHLKEDMSGEEIHQLIYSLSEKVEEEEPSRLFQSIYIALLGKTKGPRAGSFLSFLEHRFVVQRFQQAAHL